MFWWLTIGFIVVWAIAVVIEIIWFSSPDEEDEEQEAAPSLSAAASRTAPSQAPETGMPVNATAAK